MTLTKLGSFAAEFAIETHVKTMKEMMVAIFTSTYSSKKKKMEKRERYFLEFPEKKTLSALLRRNLKTQLISAVRPTSTVFRVIAPFSNFTCIACTGAFV